MSLRAIIISGSKQPSLKFKFVHGNISEGNCLTSKICFFGLGNYYFLSADYLKL